MPFRMGAFQVAAQAGIPVVPIAITGTRSVLRDGSWFPHRGPLSVIVSPPIAPKGSDWSAAVQTARCRACGNPAPLRRAGFGAVIRWVVKLLIGKYI